MKDFDLERPQYDFEVCEQVNLQLKYKGYIDKQLEYVDQMRKLNEKVLPDNIDYKIIRGLRLEAIEKLNKYKPYSIGHASRISGVSPADISVLLVWMESRKNDKPETGE